MLTRLVGEQGTIAKVAQKSLELMHFDPTTITSGSRDTRSLEDTAEKSCVAACYRCLMSYFNQPDHELLDRRDEKAREILLRLARGTSANLAWRRPSANPPPIPEGVDSRIASWIGKLDGAGLPRPDSEPLTLAERSLPLVWRAHYVAAVLGAPAGGLEEALDARGFSLVVVGADEATWDEGIQRLGRALGHTS